MAAFVSAFAPASASVLRFTYDSEASVADTFRTPVQQGPEAFIGGFGGTVAGFIDIERVSGIDTAFDWSLDLLVPRGRAPSYSATDSFTEQLLHELTLTSSNSTATRVLAGVAAGRQRIVGSFMGAINDTTAPLTALRVTMELEDVAGLGPEGSLGYRLYDVRIACAPGNSYCAGLFRDDVMLWRGTAGGPTFAGPAPGLVPLPASLTLLLSALLAMLGLRFVRTTARA